MGREDAEALLLRIEARGVRITLDGGALRVSAPKGVLTEELRAELGMRKPELIALLGERVTGRLARVPRDGTLPVSAAQQRLWFLDRVDPGNAAYNIAAAVRLHGRLQRSALGAALDDLIARHDALRTRIGERNGAPWLEITELARPQIEYLDATMLDEPDAERAALRVAEEFCRTGFDMAQGPLSRLLVIRIADDHHVLASSIHHVISDGWSTSILFNELFRFYQARVEGTDAQLKPLDYGPIDYAGWEAEQIAAHRFDASLVHWKDALRDAPVVLELPTDRSRQVAPSFRGGRLACFMDLDLIGRVKVRAQQQGATPFMALLACWLAVLHRYSGQDDVVVGSPRANRERPEFEGLIGCLINNVALRGRFDGNPTLSEFLDRVRRQALLAYEHGQVPFDLVVEQLNPPRSVSHAPIFQVLFTHLAFPVGTPPTAGLTLEPIVLPPHSSRFDLTCELSVDPFGEHAHQQRASYEYSRDLFDESSIARLHAHFEQMLVAFAEDATRKIDDVPLALSPRDRELLDASTRSVDHDRRRCAHQLLEATAASDARRLALTAGDVDVTYGELDGRANRLARLLQARGVKPRDLVAFCLDRTADLPTTMAAVLKAGAAYVPLDPTHPRDRLRYVIEDSAAACVVTLRRFAALFDAASTQLIVLDEVEDVLAGLSTAPLPVAVAPEDLAYVLYTSGSTGRPKGVEVEHRNLVAFLEAMRREPGLTADDVLLAVTTPAFDISGLEIWLPLMTGARMVIAARADLVDGVRLAELLEAHAVTMLQATPATWRLLLDTGWSGQRGLKALCGGEALPRDLAAALLPKVAELWNMYGPTETTIWSTVCQVTDAAGPVLIGHPIDNTFVRVLDANGRQVPIGVVGELCIGGEGVARGYHDRAELTAEKFVVAQVTPGRSERLYRTGDLARFTSDGQLDFLGRRDHQVKVRGYRIELGEIEAVLAGQPGIRSCTVIVREDTPGDQRLTAYVTIGAGAPFDADSVRGALRERLPDYMTPATFVVLDTLPLTPNGKIDRKALPRPAVAAAATPVVDEQFALMTPAQRRVAQVWRELLDVPSVGIADNFFDLGGHSLLLVKLHGRLRAEFATDFPLVELFQRTTVAAQAERLTAATGSSDAMARARARAERLARA